MPGRRDRRSGQGRQTARPGRRIKGRCRQGDADPPAVVPTDRTCRRTRCGLNAEACGQSAAAGVLAGARRGLDDLQAPQPSSRPANRYPDRYFGRSGRHERARTGDRQGSGRGANGRNRVRPQCGNERPGLCGPGRRGHSCRTSRHRKRARLLRGSGSCGPWRYGCDRDFDPLDPAQRQVVVASAFQSSGIIHLTLELVQMIDRKNRYGRTAARINDADGLARRPSSTTVDIHAHIVVPQAAKLAQPHVDISRVPLAYFSDAYSKEINAQQEKDVGEVMTTIDRRLRDLDGMGIDIQVVAPAPGQNYYTVDAKIAEQAHRLANDGVAEFCSRKPDRFVGLGVVTLQEPEIAVRELDYIMNDLKLRGVEILTNVDGQELSDPKFRAFFAKAEQLGAFIMMHPNGFTHGDRLTHYYLNNVLGNPLETTLALHNLIFSGTLARFPDLKLMAVHGGGYLPGYSGRIDHAWGARRDSHGELPLPPTTYLRQVYLDTVVFTYHQLAYMIDVFGPDRILMGTDYPFDMAEFNPVGHIAGVHGIDEATLAQIAGGNAARVLGLDL